MIRDDTVNSEKIAVSCLSLSLSLSLFLCLSLSPSLFLFFHTRQERRQRQQGNCFYIILTKRMEKIRRHSASRTKFNLARRLKRGWRGAKRRIAAVTTITSENPAPYSTLRNRNHSLLIAFSINSLPRAIQLFSL